MRCTACGMRITLIDKQKKLWGSRGILALPVRPALVLG
jgi:hypothetical protein